MGGRWIGAAIVLATSLALALQTSVVTRTGFLMGDFRAFYCAGRVVALRENPYYAQPLHDCEASVGSRRFFETNRGVTIPAPLPGYVFAVLVPLAMLPFGLAAAVWAALLLAAWACAVAALARAASVPWEMALAVLALSLGVLSLPFGEVVPVALAFICGAAYFARVSRWRRRRALRRRRHDRAALGPAALRRARGLVAPDAGVARRRRGSARRAVARGAGRRW